MATFVLPIAIRASKTSSSIDRRRLRKWPQAGDHPRHLLTPAHDVVAICEAPTMTATALSLSRLARNVPRALRVLLRRDEMV
jgi:hypothetical protein